MELQGYIDEIKLSLTGAGVLNLELNDEQLTRIVNSCFQEVQRYINTTKLITIPFNYCIDLTPYKVSAVKITKVSGPEKVDDRYVVTKEELDNPTFS